METHINPFGYYLYEVDHDSWIFEAKDNASFSGSFKAVAVHMVGLGFELGEIEIAISKMLKNDDNASHFGMFKCFIYSFKRENSSEKVG